MSEPLSIPKVVEILRLSHQQLDDHLGRFWYSVFHNEHRERWLFVYNIDTDETWLGGDETDWENIYPLNGSFINWIESEARWLKACESAVADVQRLLGKAGAD